MKRSSLLAVTRRVGSRLATGLLLAWLSWSVPVAAIDFDAVEVEAADLLAEYLRIDTTNPPGNETEAARFLAARFEKEAIPAEVIESQPGRGSVLARLRGRGTARPIVLLNHLDVVPADTSAWQVPPFGGVRRDGFVYGRGALDCKGIGVVQALAMFLVQRSGQPLGRDVIFLGTADEEAGGRLGAGFVTEWHRDKLGGAELVLNEGGEIRVDAEGRRVWAVAVSEKTPCWIRLTARGEAGHGSAPPPETAVTRLIGALGRIQAAEQPVRVTPEVQAFFAAMAERQPGEQRARYRDLRSALQDDGYRRAFLGNRRHAALVRNTITPTVLSGGIKTNVIPGTASAELDCRLLPDEDPPRFLAALRETIADASIEVEVLLNFPPSSSPTDNIVYRRLAAMAAADGALIAPTVLGGFTDSHYFRDQGIASYGFVPFVLDDGESGRMHGIDERISLANLRDGTRRLYELLRALDEAGSREP